MVICFLHGFFTWLFAFLDIATFLDIETPIVASPIFVSFSLFLIFTHS